MKYRVTTTRTYVTEMTIVADNESDACEWVMHNGDAIHNAELEQMNVVNEETSLVPLTPSQNELEELTDLVGHILNKLEEYRHVEEFVPKKLLEALDEMLANDDED